MGKRKQFHTIFSNSGANITLTLEDKKTAADVSKFLNEIGQVEGRPFVIKRGSVCELKVLTTNGIRTLTFYDYSAALATAKFIEDNFK